MAKDIPQQGTPASRGWAGKFAAPELWEKLKPLARQMRHEPTPAEKRLWQELRGKQRFGHKFRRQHVIERFIIDFYCPDAWLVVEVDGPIHQYTYDEDMVRQEYLEGLGLRVIRFTNEEVMKSIEEVLKRIDGALTTPPPAPPHT